MPRTITGGLSVGLAFTDRDVAGFIVEKADFSLQEALSYAFGTGATVAGEINELFASQRTLAGGASEELDLAGALMGSLGYTVAFAKVKGLFVSLPANVAPQSSGIIVGGAAAQAFAAPFGDATDKIKVMKGGHLSLVSGADVAGFAVVGGTSDKLKVANLDPTVVATYQIVLWGNT